jgi:signal transduction histidine kinase
MTVRQPFGGGTVRAWTTIAATLVVGIGLALAGIGLIGILRASLVSNVEQVAELHAADVAAALVNGAATSIIEADDDEFVQVIDSRGSVFAASDNIKGLPPVTSLAPQDEESLAETMTSPAGLEGTYRVVAISAQDPEPLTIYVGTNLKQADHTTFLLKSAVVVAVPLLLALVAAMTWVAVGRSLRPVEEIRRQVADVSNTNSGTRVPVPTADDEIRRLAVTMNAMLDRLQRAAERERRFVADASHELQTPLAAIRTQLEVALADQQPAAWTDTAQRLLETNREMEQLVSDLLFIARSDSGSPPAAPRPVDLHEVVLDEVARVNPSTSMQIDSGGVLAAVVIGRRDDLARAARNLLDNALRHATSTIVLRLSSDGHWAELTVSDDGQGIAPTDRARVFERFSRLDDARVRGEGGTGLGLSIVKEIVEQHGGTITVDGGGAGAKFVVQLPLEAEEQ